MKILLVNKYHYVKGGSETYYFGLAKLLEEHGNEVIYFAMQDEKNYACPQSEYFSKNVDFNKSMSAVQKLSAGFHALYSFDAKKKIEKLIKDEKPDIVHINLVHRHITLSILNAIQKFNIPVVLTAHDLNCVCPTHTMLCDGKVCDRCVREHSYKPAIEQKCVKNSAMQTYLAVIEAKNYERMHMYDKIDFYICPSDFYRRQFVESHITKNPIVHWVNFLPSGTQYHLCKDIDDYFLFFGRLSVEKGLMSLVKAYHKGNFENKLYLVGDGPLRKDLETYVKENNLTDKVIFTGFQSGGELKKYVEHAKCVILPSEWYENGPYSILEAIAVGKPAIVSNYGGLPEIVDDGITGFICEPNNPDSLCECLKKMNSLSDDEYSRMSESALKKAKDSCDCEAYYNKLMKCYKELIKAKGGNKI
ncbi:glycosyltransferase family 4 protein [Ruminococcus bromii]|uniref:glycosyltransferase family 4 protein n=1 Tax=Ruminococcus bromii TaxID=40518 RepID=UPI003AB1BA60